MAVQGSQQPSIAVTQKPEAPIPKILECQNLLCGSSLDEGLIPKPSTSPKNQNLNRCVHDVSQFLRRGTETPTNNRKRAEEAAAGRSNIADAEMMEAISLSEVRMMVTEWVPFGENNIVTMAQNLGVLDRCVTQALKQSGTGNREWFVTIARRIFWWFQKEVCVGVCVRAQYLV